MTGIERLEGMSMAFRGYTWGASLSEALGDIADQIVREMQSSSEVEKMKYGPVDVSMSAYDLLPQEERDAITWVREHGGLDAVKKMADITLDVYQRLVDGSAGPEMLETDADTIEAMMAEIDEVVIKGGKEYTRAIDLLSESIPRVTYERHIIKRQRQIDESHAALRRKSERIGFLVSELNRANHENHEMFMRRAGDYTAFADEVCKRLAPELRYVEGCSKDVMDAALNALDRRLMPEGMEWPRFEDGEPVRVGDEFMGKDGKTYTVKQIQLIGKFYALYDFCDAKPQFVASYGERVKRPAKVFDEDGVEIRVGDTVWHVETGEQCKVVEVDSRSVSVDFRVDGDGIKHTGSILPANLTHRAPVLAADGRPLCEGETVWGTGREQHEYTVLGQPGLGGGTGRFKVVCHDVTDDVDCDCDPDLLTHECPDSWERLEEDARKQRYSYWECESFRCRACPAVVDGKNPQERYGVDDCQDAMRCDLVRRAKALAGDA